jgi:acetyl-CoA carboxylase carboxyltransferase component
MTDHGTPARWPTCACKECDEAQRKHAHDARKMTDRDRVAAFLETIPGDGADWWYAIVKAGADILARTQNSPPGDGSVNWQTWGHVRNIVDAARQLAFVLGAAERGDDPDIPF